MNKITLNKKNPTRKLEIFDYSSKLSKRNNDLVKYNGKTLINFASNDYLGFSKNKEISNESISWIKKYGSSLSSSRLVTGNLDKIEMIEKLISKNIKHENSIIIGNGFLLNSTLIPCLTGNSLGTRNKCIIFSDKLNHASINYGCLISRQKCFRYNHLDLNHLESQLKKTPSKIKKMIISETLFSMDGDLADLNGLRYLSQKYACILYLDEAHSFGLYGKNGYGFASDGNKNTNEIIVGTFSKAIGSYGSFVSCSRDFYKKIVNSCGGLIYSTALPPSILGAISASLKKITKASKLRKKIKSNSEFLLEKLKRLNFDTAKSNSHIIPLILRDRSKCESLKKYLFDHGYFVKEISPPTVPSGYDRIRLSLTASMSRVIIKNFIKHISNFKH